jgi:hypothetical protein
VTPGRKDPPPRRAPEIEVSAAVRMRKLRFRVVPKTRTWSEGDPGAEVQVAKERDGLPETVEPGVTYRDAGARWTLHAWLAESRGLGAKRDQRA